MSNFTNTVDIIGDEALTNSMISRNITEIADDSVVKVGKSAFENCKNLTMADFSAVNSIETYGFYKCSTLKTLILRSQTVCRLLDKGAFSGSPLGSGTGYIYVPRALLSDDDATKDYRRATNWSTYAAQFRALEDYTVDGTITGELDSTKI